MKNTFLNRVSAERRVLRIVNAEFPGDEQLAGLSQAAILRWQSVVGQHRVGHLLPLITGLAEKCQRLSDRSNETFMLVEQQQIIKLEEHLEALQRQLRT